MCLSVRPVEKFHCDEALTVVLADFVDGADVGMVQRGSGVGFAAKALESLRVLRHIVRKEFSATKRPRRVSSAL